MLKIISHTLTCICIDPLIENKREPAEHMVCLTVYILFVLATVSTLQSAMKTVPPYHSSNSRRNTLQYFHHQHYRCHHELSKNHITTTTISFQSFDHHHYHPSPRTSNPIRPLHTGGQSSITPSDKFFEKWLQAEHLRLSPVALTAGLSWVGKREQRREVGRGRGD